MNFQQSFDLFRLGGIADQIAQHAAVGDAVKVVLRRHVVGGDGVPVRQRRQGDTLACFAAHAEQWHQLFECQHDIQVVTAHAATAVPQQALLAFGAVTPLWPHQQYRAVGGTAADVYHQHGFLFGQRGFEVQPCRDRLELEFNVFEPGTLGSALQNALRLLVGIFTAHALEVDWATDDRLTDAVLQDVFRLALDVEHHGTHQIFKQRDLLWLQAVGAEEGFR
ncbi:hypothetical protein D3C78_1021750 [compost metagenome]